MKRGRRGIELAVAAAALLALGTASLLWGTGTARPVVTADAEQSAQTAQAADGEAEDTGGGAATASAPADGEERQGALSGEAETGAAQEELEQESVAALSQLGSRGDEVYAIQDKLYRWGYLEDPPDGIFGEKTRAAVIWFQGKNGLVADGIVGPATLAALGLQSSGSTSGSGVTATENERALLARIISAEARGEPYEGQVAVGAVVLNRVKHPSFPNTLAGVIYQPGAFTAIVDGQFDEPVAESAVRAAADALAGYDPSGGAIYYFNPATATSSWIWSRPVIKVIGNHRFCS